jgi:hypothetical protein
MAREELVAAGVANDLARPACVKPADAGRCGAPAGWLVVVRAAEEPPGAAEEPVDPGPGGFKEAGVAAGVTREGVEVEMVVAARRPVGAE